jgi:hypothetical protein
MHLNCDLAHTGVHGILSIKAAKATFLIWRCKEPEMEVEWVRWQKKS